MCALRRLHIIGMLLLRKIGHSNGKTAHKGGVCVEREGEGEE